MIFEILDPLFVVVYNSGQAIDGIHRLDRSLCEHILSLNQLAHLFIVSLLEGCDVLQPFIDRHNGHFERTPGCPAG